MPQQHAIAFVVIIGLLSFGGGAIGTWNELRLAKSAKEKRFVWKMAAGMWLFVTGVLAVMYLMPANYRMWLFVPYMFALAWIIRRTNRHHEKLRQEATPPDTAG